MELLSFVTSHTTYENAPEIELLLKFNLKIGLDRDPTRKRSNAFPTGQDFRNLFPALLFKSILAVLTTGKIHIFQIIYWYEIVIDIANKKL